MKRIHLSQDEWLVCLEVYLDCRPRLPGARSKKVRKLSEKLRFIGMAEYGRTDLSHRPPAGVAKPYRLG